ncbi:helix-turn-helix transcriptional regulator [Geodermatophilus maliterrae]|uniref:AAA family ATPase n=1 Tax=Geodermatophilus maliterrae TaxID=3162531 RepID=A0ABV3XEK5_9ACTN
MAHALLDREAETSALERQLAQVRTGVGCTVLVDGPAGIGKSTLLGYAARLAEGWGFRVLRARGGPLEQSAGWGIARQLLAPVVRGPEWDELAVGAAGLAQRALEPDLDTPAPVGDAMHAAAHGLSWLVSGLAERSPTVLVVDDVQWADRPSLRWLVQLTRQLPDLPVAIVCAVRTGEGPSETDELTELLLAVAGPPVRPRPLGPGAVESLVRDRLPVAGASFARACHAVTSGNPFLLHALVDHLLAEGLEPTDEVAATLPAFGPGQVARSVRQQLSRLPDGASDLATAFAVLGREAPLRHAGALAGLAPPEALRLADALRSAGLVEADSGRYAFVHPLVMGALYNALPPGERALRHSRAAQLLERERSDPELVALHLLRTEPFGDPATVELLRVAARHAGARGAPESAATFLRRALVEPPAHPAEEADLRSELGLALAAHLQPEAPDLLCDAVALAASPDQRARIALSGARALGLAGHFDAAIRVCRSGLQQSGGTSPALLARLESELIGNAWLHASTIPEARDRLSRVPVATRTSGLWRVHVAWRAVFDGRPVAEVRAELDPALRDGSLDEPDSILGSSVKFMLVACGDLDAAQELCGALIDMARPRGWSIALAHGCFLRAIALVQAGRVRDAEADARLSFDVKLAASPPPALNWSLFPLVDALTELGAPADADAALAAAGQQGDPPPGALASPLLLESRARLRLAQGRPVDAHVDAQAAGDRWAEVGVVHPGVAAWRVVDAEALAALGDRASGRQLATEHLDLAERLTLPGPYGAGLRAVARNAERDETVDLLERAVAVLAGSPAQLEHVRALVDLGAALRRANHREAASEALRRALDLATRGGMQRLARRSREELCACGARPRRSAVSGIESLTPAEHRVAALAARGEGNREIAQQLYVTRRTVETHLTHVFQKLRITTRVELPRQLTAASTAAPVATAARSDG